MDWKLLVATLSAVTLLVALAVTTWKKNIHKAAKGTEIKIVAAILSVAFTVTVGYTFDYCYLPWILIGYSTIVFFLQWTLSQTILDKLWKVAAVMIKAWLKKFGAAKEDLDGLEL